LDAVLFCERRAEERPVQGEELLLVDAGATWLADALLGGAGDAEVAGPAGQGVAPQEGDAEADARWEKLARFGRNVVTKVLPRASGAPPSCRASCTRAGSAQQLQNHNGSKSINFDRRVKVDQL
jgi:hypothetical protein